MKKRKRMEPIVYSKIKIYFFSIIDLAIPTIAKIKNIKNRRKPNSIVVPEGPGLSKPG